MPTLALIIASIALTVSGWFGVHYAENNAPDVRLGANSTISNLTAKTTVGGDDLMAIVDNSISPATTKKLTFANATSSFKVFNDLTYSPIAGGTGIVTVGTITSGTWNGTNISVAKGGTGSTTLASNHVLLGDGTSGVKTVSGQGTSGSLLTSNGAGSAPTWQNVVVSLNANNTWTGTNTFNATTTIAASSTTNNALVLNGISYAFPVSRGASSTALLENGSGRLSFGYPPSRCYSIATSSVTGSSGTRTFTMNHNLGAVPSRVRADWTFSDKSGTNAISTGSGIATTTGLVGVFTAVVTSTLGSSVQSSINAGANQYFISMFADPNVLNTYGSITSMSETTAVITLEVVALHDYAIILEACL